MRLRTHVNTANENRFMQVLRCFFGGWGVGNLQTVLFVTVNANFCAYTDNNYADPAIKQQQQKNIWEAV